MAVADHFDSVQKIYIAFYQRPADPAGLRYWAERVEVAGGDTGAVINAFAASEEATALYGEINNENIGQAVTDIYQALFGRAPDAAGLAYYEEAFEAGELTAGTIALSILDGARGEDTIAINNKLEVANEFTQQVDGRDFDDANFGRGTSFAVTYNADDVEAARDILADVTAAPSTVLDANGVREALREQIANANDPIQSPGAGNNFTLTADSGEVVNGTSGVDSFNAILGVDAEGPAVLRSSTLNTFDVIDGKGGVDTLNLYIDARGNAPVPPVGGGSAIVDNTISQLPTGSSIRNVEIINIDQTNGLLQNGTGAAANTLAAAAFVGAQQIWQINNASNISGLAAGQTAGFRNLADAADPVTVGYGSKVVDAVVALDKVASDTEISLTGDALDTVTVSGSVGTTAAGGVLNLNLDSAGGASGVQTLNVALTSKTTIHVDSGFGDLVTIDASASTGGITAAMTGSDSLIDLESFIGGAGADRVAVSLARFDADEVTIDTGAGNDVLGGQLDGEAETALSLTGGAGSDTFVFLGGNVNIDDEAFENSVTITDFGTGDNIRIESFNGFTAQNVVNAFVETYVAENANADLYAVTNALAQHLGANSSTEGYTDFAAFVFEGNTYVYGDVDGAIAGNDSLNNGDLLIGLQGEITLTGTNVTGITEAQAETLFGFVA